MGEYKLYFTEKRWYNFHGVILWQKNSLDETRALKVLLAQVRGFCESIQDILHNKDTAEIGRYTSFRDMAHTYNDLAETARVLLRVPSMFYTFNVDEMPSWGDSVWPVQKKILEQVWVSAKLLYSSLEGSIDFVDDEFDNLENFIQSRLRAVIFEKPQNGRLRCKMLLNHCC